MAEFAEVVLNLPVDRAFTYRVPNHLQSMVAPGVRVRVPFRTGEQNGYVVRLADQAKFPRIKDIVSAAPESTADDRIIEIDL